jgi:hypothetical protein
MAVDTVAFAVAEFPLNESAEGTADGQRAGVGFPSAATVLRE